MQYNCVQIIHIKNSYLKLSLFTKGYLLLKPYNCVQIICIR